MSESQSVSVLLAQFPVSLSVEANLKTMLEIMDTANSGDIVVFPEGALSGYDPDTDFLNHIDIQELAEALKTLRDFTARKEIHIIFGSCIYEKGKWFNAGLYCFAGETVFCYKKVNLATSEHGVFDAGDALSTFELQQGNVTVRAAIQLCREIRFPEQWQHLSRQGAQIIFYLTNAVGDDQEAAVWDSHLISRAAENQRFVVSSNTAHGAQKCSSLVVDPSGCLLTRINSAETQVKRVILDLGAVSNWYLDQARVDLVRVSG